MKTLVYGLGESGMHAVRALLAQGAEVVAGDARNTEQLRHRTSELGVEGRLGGGPETLDGVARVVASPGISPQEPVLAGAEKAGIPVVSEVALGLELIGPGIQTVGVTGTNGKTTVVDMLGGILRGAGMPHAVAGNSWRALTGCVEEARRAGTLVLEVSSFQLHYLSAPGFHVAALLNVRPDHLNWHASFEEYARDKLKVFDGQEPDDLALVSAGDAIGRDAVQHLRAETLVVGGDGTGVQDGALTLMGKSLLAENELRFIGSHNKENALFAAAAAEKLGVTREEIRAGLASYRLQPHRVEVVAERGSVQYVNDSKATNPAAVEAALSSFERPVVLILGGSKKDTEFGEILPHLTRCRAVVCQGDAGPLIAEYLAGAGWGRVVYRVPDLERAVALAEKLSRPGDVVLLSPGCASFDQFSGYEERGDAFTRLAANEREPRKLVGR